ncbi:MAG: Asp-tRNA(Asn)/Glu-tRNA(Gln) amidotransferase subunit GatB [Desulfurococcales archaeon]|nr:Asp-tRNA(Asn)/Glu-tRNA(Gln) amidotransferase subunit GatB [Desulfurococcales archaeon]
MARKVTIGLEIHVQITGAKTKLFCNCPVDYRDKPPNTNVCPVCMGFPGALPVVNRKAIELAVTASKSLNCEIPEWLIFTRKHYFYPDLPKNYQITQYKTVAGAPVCLGGRLDYIDPKDWSIHSVGLDRINIEEDPGKAVYEKGGIIGSRVVLVDYNRSGVGLLEIVTRPELHDARQARIAVENLLLTLWYLGITDPRLPGAFRVDANISVEGGGGRVELKNIGSLIEVERGLRYEILRQTKIVDAGGKIARETRHWDTVKGVSKATRSKEEETDYMYFPDPDLPPLRVTRSMLVKAEAALEFTPLKLWSDMNRYGIDKGLAWSIIRELDLAKTFRTALSIYRNPHLIAWMLGNVVKGLRDKKGLEYVPPAVDIAYLAELLDRNIVHREMVKFVILPKAMETKESVKRIMEYEGKLPRGDALEKAVEKVLIEESKAVNDLLRGRKQAFNYLIGRVMRKLDGKGDPREIAEILRRKLNGLI